MKNLAYFVAYLVIFFLKNGYVKCCPDYSPPKNGRMICDHLLGKYCTPSCDEGYEPASLPAWAYVCNPTTKRWMTYPEFYPLPWPDCVVKGQRNIKAAGKSFVPQNVSFAQTKIYNPVGVSETKLSVGSTTKREKLAENKFNSTKENLQQQNKTTPSNSDLKSVSSTLFENSSQALSYQVVEHRQNNRTMVNKVDLTNVTYSHGVNQNMVDIGNVSITATRTQVPLSVNKTEVKQILHQSKIRQEGKDKKKKKKKVNSKQKDKPEPMPFHRGLTSTTRKRIPPHKSIVTMTNTEINGGVKEKKDNVEIVTRTTLIIKSDNKNHISIVPAVRDVIAGEDNTPSVNHTTNEIQHNITSSIANINASTSEHQNNTTFKTISANFSGMPTISETYKNISLLNNTLPSNNFTRNDTGVNNTDTSTSNSTVGTINIPQNSTVSAGNHTMSPLSNKTSSAITTVHDNVTLFGTVEDNQNNGHTSSNKTKNNTHTYSSNTKNNHNSSSIDGESMHPANISADNDLMLKNAHLIQPSEDGKTVHRASKNANNTTLISGEDEKYDHGKNIINNGEHGQTHQDSQSIDSSEKRDREADHKKNSEEKQKIWSNNHNKSLDTEKIQSIHKNVSNEEEKPDFMLNNLGNGTKRSDSNGLQSNISSDALKKTLKPVFTKRDLNLLRNMVSGGMSNSKRSELRHVSSSLWSKMLGLTANVDNKSFRKPRMPTRKDLANRDSPIARLIMSKVNKNGEYKFHDTINPFLYGLKHGALSRSKTAESNPFARQFVWNGATYVPAAEAGSFLSYLNSESGGGLSSKSNYRWNGATFVPREESDSNSEPSGSDSTKKKVFPDDITNKEIQGILDMWNGYASKNSISIPESNSPPANEKSDFNPNNSGNSGNAESAGNQGSVSTQAQINSQQLTDTPLPPTTKRPEKIYYWDGEKYERLTATSNLAEGTIKYKFDGQNYNPIGQIPYDQFVTPSITTTENKPTSSPATYNNFPTVTTTVTYPSYDWTGAVLQPQTQSPESSTSQYEHAQYINDKSNTLSEYERETTPAKTNNNIENILQAHYPPPPPPPPSPPPLPSPPPPPPPPPPPVPPPARELIDQVVAGETVKATASPVNQIQSSDLFKANIDFPTKGVSETNSYDVIKDNTNIMSTTPPVTQPSTDSPKLPTSKTAIENKPTQANKAEPAGILLPPPNPYAVNPSKVSVEATNQNHVADNFIDPKLSHVDRVKTYIKDPEKSNYIKDLPKVNPNPANPFREDAEDLQAVIENDLNIKREIESLSQLYEHSSADTLVDVPAAFKQQAENANNRLLVSRLIPPKPNLEQELNNDLHNKAPDDTAAGKDIEAADQYLQKEQDQQNFAQSNAVVQTNGNDKERTERLKAILQKAKDEDEYHNDIMGLRGGSGNTKNNAKEGYIDNLSMKEKNNIEETLKQDMAKLKSDSFQSKPISDTASEQPEMSGATGNKLSGDLGEDKFVLSVADIRELLKLTKLAERESAAKKHGLTYPTISNSHTMQLLHKPGIKRFLTYLQKNHSLIRERIGTNKLRELKKKKEKYKAELAKLLSSWNSRYHQLKLANKRNPLPKFVG